MIRRVLIDECLPLTLRHIFPKDVAVTVRYMGWLGIKNGKLMRLAEENGIDVLLTADRTMHLEHPLKNRQISVVVLPDSDIHALAAMGNRIRDAVQTVEVGGVRVLDP